MRKRLVAVIGSGRMFQFWVDTMVGGRHNRTHQYFEMANTRYIHVYPDDYSPMEALLLDDWIELAGEPILPKVIEFARTRVLQNEHL